MTTSIKGKVLPRLNVFHKQFLKLAFKRIDFHQVNIHQDALQINGHTIRLIPVAEYPEYTNEQLSTMPVMELWELAKDFGFDPLRYDCDSFAAMMHKYGESAMRSRLKAYVYCHEDNHPVRCYALSKRTNKVVDLARELWTCNKLAGCSSARYNILQYTKPGIHLLKTLEII